MQSPNRLRRRELLSIITACCLLGGSVLQASTLIQRHCSRCGCQNACRTVCRLEKEDRKVTVVCWGIRDEDFCLGGPSCPDCEECESVCANCASKASNQTEGKESTAKTDSKSKGDESAAKSDSKKAESKEPLDVRSRAKRFVWTRWIPGPCGDVYTRKKLMKKTVTKTVPSFKWVVEELCDQCLESCESPKIPTDVPVPPPPKIEGALVLPSK